MKYIVILTLSLLLSLGLSGQNYKVVRFVNYFDSEILVLITDQNGNIIKSNIIASSVVGDKGVYPVASYLKVPDNKKEKLYYQIKTLNQKSYSRIYKLRQNNFLHDSDQLLDKKDLVSQRFFNNI